MRIIFHKFLHWEYWPTSVIYFPTILLWGLFALRFRSFRFYRFANPGMTNGGLYGDGKMEIYAKLPPRIFPLTVLLHQGTSRALTDILELAGMHYPLIVKPDVGCRGVGVAEVQNISELQSYLDRNTEAILLQEKVEFAQEIGLFYCRLPGATRGEITGITVKKFLEVTGNGHETIETLLSRTMRSQMQIAPLSQTINIHEILPLGEKRVIVPFGNHNRGTEFLNGHQFISSALLDVFDPLLRSIDGFYFGRLDIRFDNWKDLYAGRQFSIIEINGAKSEPTHIYDPSWSYWRGQREIFRHQKKFYDIVVENYKRRKQ